MQTIFLKIIITGLLIFSFARAQSQQPPKPVTAASDTIKTFGPALSDSSVLKPASKAPDSMSLTNALKASDSLKKITATSGNPAAHDSSLAIDTTYSFWHYRHFGIGAGWSLGSFPLFDEWIKGLPDSAKNIIGPSSEVPSFSIKEPADAYNILWPITVWWAVATSERQSLCLEGSFFWITKSFEAYLQNDSNAAQWVHWQQSLSVYSFSVGFDYKYTIPEEFFHVENAAKTSIVLGLSATPLLLVDKSASFSSSGIADSTIASAQATIDNRSLRGLGCAWKVGLSSLHRLSTAKGLEISVSYIGRWYGYFRDHGTPAVWREINPLSAEAGQNISFVSSTFEISFALVSGKKPHLH